MTSNNNWNTHSDEEYIDMFWLRKENSDTFLFGKNQLSETILIHVIWPEQLQLTDPCWIRVVKPKPVTGEEMHGSCKYEYIVENPMMQISRIEDQLPSPSLKFLSICAKTMLNGTISCISVVEAITNMNLQNPDRSSFSIVSVKSPYSDQYHNVFVQPNERALLSLFCAQIYRRDPDFIVIGPDFELLLRRLQDQQIKFNFSRLKPSFGCGTIGRSVIDTIQVAKAWLEHHDYGAFLSDSLMTNKSKWVPHSDKFEGVVIATWEKAEYILDLMFRLIVKY
jgi:DNA polymerase elongation subunit (family B)